MNLEKAIEAAAEVLNEAGYDCWNMEESRGAARITVEAAAPHLLPDVHWALVLDEERQRAERAEAESATHFRWAEEMQECLSRAEAEVERLNELALQRHNRIAEERLLADRLAEALQEIRRNSTCLEMYADPALAAYEEARRGT
jgi:hypothetical protein